jgi:hypothetical protein
MSNVMGECFQSPSESGPCDHVSVGLTLHIRFGGVIEQGSFENAVFDAFVVGRVF